MRAGVQAYGEINIFGETHSVLNVVVVVSSHNRVSCIEVMTNYGDSSSVNKPLINHYHNDLNQPAELFDVCSTPRIKMKILV